MLLRTTVVLAVLAFSLPAFAQQRGNTPPGMSTDGARPADGAIQGGSPILPGESAGMPDKEAAIEKMERCKELKGSLREECLMKERSAAGGSSAPAMPEKPRDNMGANGEEPGRSVK